MKKLFVLALMLVTVVAFGANPVVVDDGGSGDFLTLQAAITSWCTGGANAGETPPFVINILAGSGPYDEAISLDEADTVTRGDIVGDLVIQSSDGSLVQLACQSSPGPNNSGDGFLVLQSVHDVTIRDLIIYPSQTGTVIDDDIVRLDEDDTNTTFNTITFENCIMTEIDTAGNPLVTTMAAAATDPPSVTVGSNRTNSYPYLFQWWGDDDESQHVVLTDCAIFNNPHSYMVRVAGAGADGETFTMTDCITRGGGYCNIRASASYATAFLFTGTDQTDGWQNCAYNTDPIAGHGVYFSSSSGGPTALVEKMIIRTTDRAISGNAGMDMDLIDCIFEYTAVGVVDGPANASQWTNVTFDGQDAASVYFGVGGAGSITARDCIFSNNTSGIGGTMPTGGVDVDYCALVGWGPDANAGSPLVDWAITGVKIGVNCIDADPLYLGKNPELASHYDVDNGSPAPAGYQGAGTGASNLAGGADYVGGSTVIDWSIY
jgi:hypothetical protein